MGKPRGAGQESAGACGGGGEGRVPASEEKEPVKWTCPPIASDRLVTVAPPSPDPGCHPCLRSFLFPSTPWTLKPGSASWASALLPLVTGAPCGLESWQHVPGVMAQGSVRKSAGPPSLPTAAAPPSSSPGEGSQRAWWGPSPAPYLL